MILTLPLGGDGQHIWQCTDCDRPDPLHSETAKGWINGPLGIASRIEGAERAN